jgi:hypothetical protein
VNYQQYDNLFRTTIICIDSYENKVPIGRLYNSLHETGAAFHGTMELLLSIESMLEEMKGPQSFSVRRSFRPPEERPAPSVAADAVREGKVATFSLRILFRQNVSWQGSVLWCDGRQEESFRSVLELLLLMDSALGAGK